MRVARDPLLLGSADIGAPAKCVIAPRLGPVVYPLEMVLGFLERAIALVDIEGISEAESAVRVGPVGANVECRHSAGFSCAQIQSRDTSIAPGSET